MSIVNISIVNICHSYKDNNSFFFSLLSHIRYVTERATKQYKDCYSMTVHKYDNTTLIPTRLVR